MTCEKTIEKAFVVIDSGEATGVAQVAPANGTTVNIGQLTVGSGSVAISAAGDASSTCAPSSLYQGFWPVRE